MDQLELVVLARARLDRAVSRSAAFDRLISLFWLSARPHQRFSNREIESIWSFFISRIR